jgi:hypothetical protein
MRPLLPKGPYDLAALQQPAGDEGTRRPSALFFITIIEMLSAQDGDMGNFSRVILVTKI